MSFGKLAKVMTPYKLARYALRTWRDARPVARKRNVSVLHIVREQVALKRQTELRPDEYYLFGLDDPDMPWEDKLSYISDAGRRMWYIMTPPKFHGIYRNKLLFKRFFQGLGLPVAELYGVYDPDWGETVSGQPLRTAEDIDAWMQSTDVQAPVFKPTESAEGKMIYVMTGRAPDNDAAFQSIDGAIYTPDRIVQTLNDPQLLASAYPDEPIQKTFLVEARLHSHPKVTEITTSETLCCVRLVTLVTNSGEAKIWSTYFKITPQNTGADNTEEGSRTIFAYVDPDTGVLGDGYFYYDHDPTPYRAHPRQRRSVPRRAVARLRGRCGTGAQSRHGCTHGPNDRLGCCVHHRRTGSGGGQRRLGGPKRSIRLAERPQSWRIQRGLQNPASQGIRQYREVLRYVNENRYVYTAHRG